MPVRMHGEDLTRVLVNLVKNATEALTGGGRIQIALRSQPIVGKQVPHLLLSVEDSGPGIPRKAQEKIFESGFTTRSADKKGNWPASHRGLGLSITRAIVEAAGGQIRVVNRTQPGARFEIELPVRTR